VQVHGFSIRQQQTTAKPGGIPTPHSTQRSSTIIIIQMRRRHNAACRGHCHGSICPWLLLLFTLHSYKKQTDGYLVRQTGGQSAISPAHEGGLIILFHDKAVPNTRRAHYLFIFNKTWHLLHYNLILPGS